MHQHPLIVEVDFAQTIKYGQNTCGDYFVSKRIPAENRLISVLSDGLGSGINLIDTAPVLEWDIQKR